MCGAAYRSQAADGCCADKKNTDDDDDPAVATDVGEDVEYYPEEFNSGGPLTEPSHHEPDPADPSNWCYECGDTSIGHCGCCRMPLCHRHVETQAGFCSDRTVVETPVGEIPACIRPGLDGDDEQFDVAVDAPAFNYERAEEEQFSPDELRAAVREALPDALIKKDADAVTDAVDAAEADDADAATVGHSGRSRTRSCSRRPPSAAANSSGSPSPTG